MLRRWFSFGLAAALATALATPGRAVVVEGSVAPNFTKNQLAPGPATGSPVSLSDYAGKVVVLALAGYN